MVKIGITLAMGLLLGELGAGAALPEDAPVGVSREGRLVYRADAQGNTIPDFSTAGYGGGGAALPTRAEVPTVITLEPNPGSTDDTARIQAAIDELSARPLASSRAGAGRADGAAYRGAILLSRGTYRVGATLRISASGIIVRGEGNTPDGTVIIAAGTGARSLFEVKGKPLTPSATGRVAITAEYVPVGAREIPLRDTAGFSVGQSVLLTRVGNAAWISHIGMDRITPRAAAPGEKSDTVQWTPFDLVFDRVVTAVGKTSVTLDAPLTCAIEARWGGGSLAPYTDADRISHVGLEDFTAVSEFDRSVTLKQGKTDYFADEKHATYVATLANVKNAFVRRVTSRYFIHGPANCVGGAKWVTVQDCQALEPVSKIDGGRRYPFAIQGGQLVLFNRCYAERDRHAFVVGARVTGPNVFLECVSENAYNSSEPHHRWSVGGLYDNVSADIAIQDRQYLGTGHGWSGANYVAWNTKGRLILQAPPTAMNISFGHIGPRPKPAFPVSPTRPEGIWISAGQPVEPASLYKAQLRDRLGNAALDALKP